MVIFKDGDKLVFEGHVDHPAIVINSPLLLVFSEEALLLPGRRTCWDGCRFDQIRWVDEEVVRNLSVLLGWKYKPEVAILISSKVALGQHRVFRPELVAIFDWRVIRL